MRTAVAAPAFGAATVLWRFGRPHTVIGTTLSVVALWLLGLDAFSPSGGTAALHLACTLVAALGVNIAIVGINQVEDVDIDGVNKPWLPIAAGDLSLRDARAIVSAAALVALVLALTQGWLETVAVAGALAVGWAYSVPPLRLKRFPALASISISGVRGIVVNLGVWLHFAAAFGDSSAVSEPVWAVTAFVLPFSFAIAILKDVPDIDGDRRYGIGTFSVRWGAARVARLGVGVLVAGYVAMAVAGGALVDGVSTPVWVLGHVAALAALLRWRAGVDPGDPARFTRFYMRVWALFFAEYVLVAAAALSG